MAKNLRNVFLAGVALAVFSAPTSAATMKAVYQGTITNSDDQTNVFGQGTGSVLDGLSYVYTLIYDTATLGQETATSPILNQIDGGTSFAGSVSPVVSAVFTVGNHSENISGSYGGLISHLIDGSFSSRQDSAVDRIVTSGIEHYAYVFNEFSDEIFSLPYDLDKPFSVTSVAYIVGTFTFSDLDMNTAQFITYASGTLSPTSLTVTRLDAPSEVPVPAALPLFAAGIGALCLASRRRRKQKAAV
jgi:hypothetical protein